MMRPTDAIYFRRELDMGAHQVAHRNKRSHPASVFIHEVVSPDVVLEEYSYTIVDQTRPIKSTVSREGRGCRTAVRPLEQGLWAVYISDRENEAEDEWMCSAIVASSQDRPRTLGGLRFLVFDRVDAPADWNGLLQARTFTAASAAPLGDLRMAL